MTYEQKLARVLDAMGALFTVDDLLTRIGDGRMQSFAVNNSWAITEIQPFPRATKLNVVAWVGDLEDGEAIHDKIMDFARETGIGLISAYGRRGWMPNAKAHGWKVKAKSFLYHREM